MNLKYYNYNDTDIALIGKSGSSAIGKAITLAIKPYYEVRGSEENVAKINNAPGVWQGIAPKTETPANPIIPVRDPVERFRSACAQDGRTAEEQLAKVEAGDFTLHTRPTSDWLTESCRLVKFPEHVDYIAAELGLDEIPAVNDSESNNGPKPDLTADELARVQAVYADDIALYESITEAGQAYTASPKAATDEAKATKIREFESARWREEISGTTVAALGDAFVHTDKETQSELGKALAFMVVDPLFEIDWRFPDGTIVRLEANNIKAVAQTVFTHVQATRTKFKEKVALVAAASTSAELAALTW